MIKLSKICRNKFKRRSFTAMLLSCSFLLCGFNSPEVVTEDNEIETISENFEPVPFIIDSDMCPDVDDALAIELAMWFQNKGLIDIRGMAFCTMSARSAFGASAIMQTNKQYDIPLAIASSDGIALGSDYIYGMCDYPHSENIFYGTTNFYRMLLASSSTKVNIVSTGQLTNLNDLLNSGPDAHSDLTGAELIAEKVDTLYCVAGKSNGGLENNIFYGGEDYGGNKYYNNTKVAEAADNVARNWTSEIVWLEADLVGSFSVGDFYEQVDKSSSYIITKALKDYGTSWGSASFDPFGVYIAFYDKLGESEQRGIEYTDGVMHINWSGTSYFTDIEGGPHKRITKVYDDGYYRWEINKLLQENYERNN